MIAELQSWLPNYNHGPNDYPTLLWRILASLPGGDEVEDMGYEPFNLGWHEADQLGRVLEAIQDKRDVEDLVRGLLSEEEENVEEPPRRREVRPRPPPSYPAGRPRRPAPESARERQRSGYVVAKGEDAREWSRHRTIEAARREKSKLLAKNPKLDVSIWRAADFDDTSGRDVRPVG
jgi:hypothetical protein